MNGLHFPPKNLKSCSVEHKLCSVLQLDLFLQSCIILCTCWKYLFKSDLTKLTLPVITGRCYLGLITIGRVFFVEASTDNEEQLQFPLELCSDPLSSQPFSPAKGQLRGAILNRCFYGFWLLLSHSCRGFKISVLPQSVNVLCCPGTMGLLTPVESFLSPRGWLGWSFSGFPVFALRILRMLQARGVGCHKDQCPDNEPLLSVAHRNTSSHNDSHCFHDGKYFICQRLLACKFALSERSRTLYGKSNYGKLPVQCSSLWLLNSCSIWPEIQLQFKNGCMKIQFIEISCL